MTTWTQLLAWFLIMVLAIGVEMATMGLASIWFAGGALVAIFASLLRLPLWVQILLFLVVSLVMLFYTRPIAMKHFNKDRAATNAESLVGGQAIVIETIDNLRATGHATVNGQEWMARSADDAVTIPENAVVEIVKIDGVKLIVKAKN